MHILREMVKPVPGKLVAIASKNRGVNIQDDIYGINNAELIII